MPAVIALVLLVRRRSLVAGAGNARGGDAVALALVHPTYALFLLIPLAGYVAARAALARTELRRGRPRARGGRRAGDPRRALAARRSREETVSATPRDDRAPARAAALRGPARRLRRRHATGSRPRCSARAGAVAVAALVARAARRVRRPPPLGRVRARRHPRRARADARADAVHAPLGRRLALAGPPRRRRSCRSPFAARRRRGRARPLLSVGALPGRARRRDRAPARLPRRLRLRASERRAGARDLGRAVRRRRRAGRRGSSSAPLHGARPDGPARGAAVALFDPAGRAHGFATGRAAGDATQRAAAGPRRCAARTTVPKRAVVFSDDPRRATAIAAFAPVYVAARAAGHVADTKANRPYERRARRAGVLPHRRPGDPAPVRRGNGSSSTAAARRCNAEPAAGRTRTAVRPLPSPFVKVLLVSMYFPPAGGGGVQRTLKAATHLPALGIETHVLAPDDPKWVHRDDELRRRPRRGCTGRATSAPAAAARRGAARHAGPRAAARPGEAVRAAAARPRRERHLEPDRDPGGDPDRAPRGDRRRAHDVAAQLGAPRRRRGEAGDRRAVGRRPARLARRPPAPARARAPPCG